MNNWADPADIRHLLTATRRWAVAGASMDASRPSHGITRFLIGRGFDVTPVNPGHAGATLHGPPIVATLTDAQPLEVVDIFRRSDQAGAVVAEAVRLGASAVWMQLGVVDEAAAEAARRAGLRVVMDRCPAIEWRRLNLP